MRNQRKFVLPLTLILGMGLSSSCDRFRSTQVIGPAVDSASAPTSGADSHSVAPSGLRRITILATNDLHGGVEPELDKTGRKVGGSALLAGAIQAVRQAAAASTDRGVLLLDGGDQFQGTLLSNFDEGQLVFSLYNRLGYDAIVPGNHDYDFGPLGWLDDRVNDQNPDKNPRSTIERLAASARFPLLSANTYEKSSLMDLAGKPVTVEGVGCVAGDSSAVIDWSRARRPGFLRPYVIRNVADVRVALIGIDNQFTPNTTTAENVSDLCFRRESDEILAVRQELEGKADVFVLMMHNGDSQTETTGSALVAELLRARPDAIDAVVAGHTHAVNDVEIDGVPMIQSGSGGKMFGRVDLVYDLDARRVVRQKMRKAAGIRLLPDRCSAPAAALCSDSPGSVAYEGIAAPADVDVKADIARARAGIADLAGRKLGSTPRELWRNRTGESPLSNLLTDALRSATGADIAMINTGGIRDSMPAGDIDYETLFKVIPMSNHAVVLGDVPASVVLALIETSIQTCGEFGALLPSGIRVTFERNCKVRQREGRDREARLLRVETVGGEVIFDREKGIRVDDSRKFTVATLDFLASGGSAFKSFIGQKIIRDFGVFREILTEELERHPLSSDRPARVDQRWKEITPVSAGERR